MANNQAYVVQEAGPACTTVMALLKISAAVITVLTAYSRRDDTWLQEG